MIIFIEISKRNRVLKCRMFIFVNAQIQVSLKKNCIKVFFSPQFNPFYHATNNVINNSFTFYKDI